MIAPRTIERARPDVPWGVNQLQVSAARAENLWRDWADIVPADRVRELHAINAAVRTAMEILHQAEGQEELLASIQAAEREGGPR